MSLSKSDKTLIIVAVIICIAIACIAPFLASSNPDGLEKTLEDSNVPEEVATAAVSSPLPHCSLEHLGKIGEIGESIIGIIITLLVAFGISYVIKKRN